MSLSLTRINKNLLYLPIVGIVIYVAVFFIARPSYGGGLETYSFGGHLFCDLMEKVSNNGFENDARSIAIFGNCCLFIGMATFFYLVPMQFRQKKKILLVAQYIGVAAMLNFLFLFTTYHDTVVLISGILGVTLAFILIREYLGQMSIGENWFPITCLVLSALVFASFQFKIGIDYLPTFQKFVFLCDSVWVFTACLAIAKLHRERVVASV